MPTPTNLIFAPAPTITMVDNVVLIDVEGLSSDWDAYTFSLNISSPGTKRIVLRIQHPEFHKHGRPRVKEPYAQPLQVESIALEQKEPIKAEEASQALLNSELEQPNEYDSVKSEESVGHENGLQSASVAPFPCTLLTWKSENPQDMPSQPSKYYLRSFDPSILPIEIMQRKDGMARHEERLEREAKRRRLDGTF